MAKDTEVEAVARALYAANDQEPDSVEFGVKRWACWANDARVAIAALDAVRGKEPTP